MKNNQALTLTEFILDRQSDHPGASGTFTQLMNDLVFASKIVNREVNKAGLVDILGAAGKENIQGEEVKKLDVYANDVFIDALRAGRECAAIASEEDDDIVVFEGREDAPYLVAMDPLDGSSNIDVNVSIGTIFSIFKREKTGKVTRDEFFKTGKDQVAAGYIIYGSSTMLVYTTGAGVNGFTLDPSIGSYCLSHPDIKSSDSGKIYSINEGNFARVSEGLQDYVRYCQEDVPSDGRPFTARYIGSLVADFHRNLIKGGIYIYPSTSAAPKGKLRLLYECAPMAFIAEQAGGLASDGKMDIMDIQITELHQRVPLFVGSKDMVNKALSFL